MSEATILLADDEEGFVEAFEYFFPDDYEVLTATTGEEAVDLLGPDVDVVFLDRRMPGITGDEVLEVIRERGYPCRVALMTAIDPDFDIIDLDFDEYLIKPVHKDELLHTLERLVALGSVDEPLRQLYPLMAKKRVLDTSKSRHELSTSGFVKELRILRDFLNTDSPSGNILRGR